MNWLQGGGIAMKMKTKEEIEMLLRWLENEVEEEPPSWPEPGYIYHKGQAIDVLKWVLEQ